MTSAISSVSSMVNSLFSKIDTSNKGYIDQTGLQSAFDQISSTSSSDSSSSSSVDKLFSTLDSDSDGKLTKQEMTDGLTKLADELNNQFNQSRISSASSQDTSGYTKDELTSMISDLGSSDSKRTTLMTSIVNNFTAADANGDGKVSNQEAMAYDQSTQTSATSSTGSTTAMAGGVPPPPPSGASSSSDSSSSSSSSSSYDAADTNQDGVVSAEELIAYESSNSSSSDSLSVMKMMAQLMQAYGSSAVNSSAASSTISAVA